MQIHFVLVEPAVPENVGAAARALKTMGFHSLWIINSWAHHDPRAGYLAHASNDILQKVQVFDTLDEVLELLDFSIATSSKTRHVRHEYHQAEKIPELMQAKSKLIAHAGIIFGREEFGLKNDELKKCDMISWLPMHTSYPSLNLSQAVMVYAYLLSSRGMLPASEAKPFNKAELQVLKNKVEKLLPLIDLPPSSNIYPRILERLMHITHDDVHLLHSICNELLKKFNREGT